MGSEGMGRYHIGTGLLVDATSGTVSASKILKCESEGSNCGLQIQNCGSKMQKYLIGFLFYLYFLLYITTVNLYLTEQFISATYCLVIFLSSLPAYSCLFLILINFCLTFNSIFNLNFILSFIFYFLFCF